MHESQEQIFYEHLYEVGNCSICHDRLVENLICLGCGHVYHHNCFLQQLEYNKACAICRKHATEKEMRFIHYPLEHNLKVINFMTALKANLSESETKQIEKLFQTVNSDNEQICKLKAQIFENEREIKSKLEQIQALRTELVRKDKETESIKRQFIISQKALETLQKQCYEMEMHEIKLRNELHTYREHQQQYDNMRKMKKIMAQNSEQIMKYKQELQMNQTSAEEMAKVFFDMILVKHLEVLRIKDKLAQYPIRINEKDNQINKLRTLVDSQKKELRETFEKKIADKRKYEDLKVKYKLLLEKAKSKDFKEGELPEYDDSNGFTNLIKPLLNIDEIESMQVNLSTKRSANETPFNSFGGLKKKTEAKAKVVLRDLMM